MSDISNLVLHKNLGTSAFYIKGATSIVDDLKAAIGRGSRRLERESATVHMPPKDTEEEAQHCPVIFEDTTLARSSRFRKYTRDRGCASSGVVGNAAVHHWNTLIASVMTTDVTGAIDGIDIPPLRRRVRARQLRIQVNRVCVELLISVGDSVWGMTNRTGDPHVQDMGAVMLENRVFGPSRYAVA